MVSFTAGNRPEAVPLLLKYVLGELERAQNQFKVPETEAHRERVVLVRKFRDAIFKCGITGGYSKVSCLFILRQNRHCDEISPIVNKRPRLSPRGHARGTTRYGTTEVCDLSKRSRIKVIVSCRETDLSLTELDRRGEIFFRALYGDTADNVQGLLDKIYPDMGTYTMPLEYADLERRHRVVQQHDCLRIGIRLPRNLDSTRDVVRLGGHAHRGGHPPPDRLAPQQRASRRCIS